MSRDLLDRPSVPSETATDGAQRPANVVPELNLLNEIIRMLPIGLTVRDEHGDFLLVNEAAAAHFETTAKALAEPDTASVETLPGSDAPPAAAAEVLQHYVTQADGTRVLLTTERPIRISDRTLMLSASIDFTRHKTTEEELSRRAYFDELTGVPKRTVLEARINDILARDSGGGRFALVFLDIDNFKHINDYYGHAAGDALLVKFAKRLQSELRPGDVVARISGDEFLLLLDPIESEIELATALDHLLQRLKAPLLIDDFEIFASASIGASLYPQHGRSYDMLCHNADIAMYRVKSEIKGGFAIFDSHMEREATARTELEQALRLAILEKRFRCAFQPKVDIRTREIIGVEALIRLTNESGVIQAPATFIELAVELGLIDELSYLVLDEVMMSIDLIDERFGRNTSISLNVAAKQAGNAVFMRAFVQALEATGCSERFMIEVTEEAFLRKSQFQSEILPHLRKLGVRVSIDDFGTGYSSLSALAEITADEIKIDRSFITDIHKRPRSQAVLRAIESLSEALGMSVIAEGVETFEELAYLQAASRIRYAQGFYFSKPVFLDELTASQQPVTGHPSIGHDGTVGRQPHEDRYAQQRSRSAGR
ncbi:putative bifunctional diguanylate cyclase/phosphodiesterase [Bradyrhizobium prioriisuperbiae]|uniref:putative bifunctional diguanylate cyclase/phosphodiesterase n=1 Tax=Bradyrhizobium prioriisuperbiae TaxID=2854389 RepID=UPI0038991E67